MSQQHSHTQPVSCTLRNRRESSGATPRRGNTRIASDGPHAHDSVFFGNCGIESRSSTWKARRTRASPWVSGVAWDARRCGGALWARGPSCLSTAMCVKGGGGWGQASLGASWRGFAVLIVRRSTFFKRDGLNARAAWGSHGGASTYYKFTTRWKSSYDHYITCERLRPSIVAASYAVARRHACSA